MNTPLGQGGKAISRWDLVWMQRDHRFLYSSCSLRRWFIVRRLILRRLSRVMNSRTAWNVQRLDSVRVY